MDSNIASAIETTSATAVPTINLEVSEIYPVESNIATFAAVSCEPSGNEEAIPPTSFPRSSLWSSLRESQRGRAKVPH